MVRDTPVPINCLTAIVTALLVTASTIVASAQSLEDVESPSTSPLLRSVFSVQGGVATDAGFQATQFDSLFDSITGDESIKVSNVSLMKQHVLYARHGENNWGTGWRISGAINGVYISGGDEVVGGWLIDSERLSALASPGQERLRDARFSIYTTTGVRLAQYASEFYFEGTGSILGRTVVDTRVDHDIVGPQLGIGAVAESGVWRFEALFLALLGHMEVEYTQAGSFGEEAIPGALNRSAISRTTVSGGTEHDDRFGWNGEMRLAASCRLTQRLRFDAGWRAIVVGPISSASAATAWNAPDFDINPSDGESELFDYWTFGLTYEY